MTLPFYNLNKLEEVFREKAEIFIPLITECEDLDKQRTSLDQQIKKMNDILNQAKLAIQN